MLNYQRVSVGDEWIRRYVTVCSILFRSIHSIYICNPSGRCRVVVAIVWNAMVSYFTQRLQLFRGDMEGSCEQCWIHLDPNNDHITSYYMQYQGSDLDLSFRTPVTVRCEPCDFRMG